MSEHKTGVHVHHNSNKPIVPVEIKEEYKVVIAPPKPPDEKKGPNLLVMILMIYGVLLLLVGLSQYRPVSVDNSIPNSGPYWGSGCAPNCWR
jgi:hypothetical protein